MRSTSYYNRFINLLEDDLNLLLTEVDPVKHNHKQIKSLLDLLDEAETKVNSIEADNEFETLSPETQAKIKELIALDLGREL